jgi:predicted phosphodiesterase
MKYAILADIHANLTAFETVLADIVSKGGVDGYWHLGDMVGYGPDPRECIETARKYGFINIIGNHDWAAIGKIDISEFNEDAARAVKWTKQQLRAEDIHYFESLPKNLVIDDFTLVHGSPRKPIWEYVLSTKTAKENLNSFFTSYCLVGHSHLTQLFECNDSCSYEKMFSGTVVNLGQKRLIINPGSVGQPRDNDPRTSYSIFDSAFKTITFYRVEYDIPAVQARMAKAGLPARLINRLENGV